MTHNYSYKYLNKYTKTHTFKVHDVQDILKKICTVLCKIRGSFLRFTLMTVVNFNML